jgi:ABC-type lipoprotein release transport system permease subunit
MLAVTLNRLRLQSLLYHWRGNAAVFLGVVVGTMVLTGALLVGDSLRGSLAEQSRQRLGWVEQALTAPRFFREDLADDLQRRDEGDVIHPAILLQGSAVVRPRTPGQPSRQCRGVTILGVDHGFWVRFGVAPFHSPRQGRPLRLNSTLADALQAGPGDEVALRLQKPSAIPRETLLGRRDEASLLEEVTFKVGGVLKPGEAGDAFSLRSEVEAPRTAFLPLSVLQDKLGLQGRCNALLAGENNLALADALHRHLTLDDWGLELRDPDSRVRELFKRLDKNHDDVLQPSEWRNRLPAALVRSLGSGRNPPLPRERLLHYLREHRNYLSLESNQMLLEPAVEGAALEAGAAAKLRAAPTLVYLANTITAGGKKMPYSIVAALDPAQRPPLGPFLPPGVEQLADDQILFADWQEMSLPKERGEEVTLTYFPPEHRARQRENSARFRLAGVLPLKGSVADAELTPQLAGITDQARITDWDLPFSLTEKIGDADERYWQDYRTTPKAFVTLAAGQQLWSSRFGRLTSIRLAAQDKSDLAAGKKDFERGLLERLDTGRGGFVFNDVRAQAERASRGGGFNFSGLFVGFSFFLIVAALLLVGLLFRLNLDRRASEIGLLLALGYRRQQVRRLLVAEGSVVAAAGAVAGTGLAMLYAGWLLRLLAALWPDASLQSILHLHYTALSLAGGGVASLAVSVLTILWAVFSIGRMPPSVLLAGQAPGEGEGGPRSGPRVRWWLAGASLVGAVVLLGLSGQTEEHEMRAMTFFGSGSLLLTACLASLSAWMRRQHQRPVEGHGLATIARLGIRNAARHPTRSLLTAGLLASAAFLLVAVEAFRQQVDPGASVGGFPLVAESDVPLVRDLGSPDSRNELLDKLLVQYREEAGGDNDAAQRRVEEAAKLIEQTDIVAFRVHAGDDVSCLNLYQPLKPRVLGVPSSLAGQNTFTFAATSGQSLADRANPWLLLDSPESPLPAFGEKNTVEWMLNSGLGKTVSVPAGQGGEQPLRIVGLLQGSVFQSSLLVSEANFLRLYPEEEGYRFFLIRPPAGQEEAVRRLLERGLAERGFEVTPAAERLQAYLAVENMYLSTFQALGGLGLLLGSLGLAVVLLRGVWERRGELALLRALGYRPGTLAWLILAENAFLLLVGLAAGTASALIAVSPHLLHQAAIPWLHLLGLLVAVVLAGLVAGILATISTLRAPLIVALRRE